MSLYLTAAGDSNVYEMDAMNDDVEYMTRKLNTISNEVETGDADDDDEFDDLQERQTVCMCPRLPQ